MRSHVDNALAHPCAAPPPTRAAIAVNGFSAAEPHALLPGRLRANSLGSDLSGSETGRPVSALL